jgi:hypothetical protein
MQSKTATEQRQDSRKQDSSSRESQRQMSQQQNARHQYGNLDTHYRKIGISAVAAAVRCKSQPRDENVQRYAHVESD